MDTGPERSQPMANRETDEPEGADPRDALMRQAMDDPGFVADLWDTMHAFRFVDEEWWERDQAEPHVSS